MEPEGCDGLGWLGEEERQDLVDDLADGLQRCLSKVVNGEVAL
jgi:hypothetical protein